jgi:hypothetical protein
MRKVLLVAALGLLMVGMMGATALAEEPPPHPHMLLLHLELDVIDGTLHLVGFHRCVDLAANRPVPLNAHHAHIHTGKAGEALFNAGHVVAPGAPLTPWANCAELEADLPLPVE